MVDASPHVAVLRPRPARQHPIGTLIEMVDAAPIKTEHPHVERVPGVCGGRPVVAGTRIPVAFIIGQLATGDTPSDIAIGWPRLSLAAIHDAISYYYDHQAEIDRDDADNTPAMLARRLDIVVDAPGRVHFSRR